MVVNIEITDTQLFDLLYALNVLLSQNVVTEKGIANRFVKRANLEAFKMQIAKKLIAVNQMNVCAN